MHRLFEDVFMDIDWSLYDDETADLTGIEEKILDDMNGLTHHPKTKGELIVAIKEELANGNTNLNCINTSDITDMANLFNQNPLDQNFCSIRLSEKQQKTLDVSDWDVSNVTDMSYMFWGCINFNQDLSGWDVSNVESMQGMFDGCTKFNQDLSEWDVSNVESMSSMFKDCADFDQNISKWDVRNVKYMSGMFDGCTDFNQDLSGWDVRSAKGIGGMYVMFYGCTKLEKNGLIPDWYKHKLKLK